MSGQIVVKRYARALFEASREQGRIEDVRDDMNFITSLLSEAPQIREYCLARHTSRNNEWDFVSSAFLPYISEITGRTLEALVRNGRLGGIPFLPDAFQEQEDRESCTLPLRIESVQPLSREILGLLEEKMHGKTGRRLRMENSLKPEILGGIRIIWDNRMMDLSLQGRLKKMKRLLK